MVRTMAEQFGLVTIGAFPTSIPLLNRDERRDGRD